VGFTVEFFLPHLQAAISQLVHLIGEAESFESKRRVENALNIVIEQTGQQVGVPPSTFPFLLLSLVKDFTFRTYYYRTAASTLYVYQFDGMSDVC
jgi:hypothetical protein